MTKREQILAVLSTSGKQSWTPVQVQKIFFLLDRKVPSAFGGPLWDFTPYDYGPFDSDVYRQIELLSHDGLAAVVHPNCGIRQFFLTPKGQEEGQRILSSIETPTTEYIRKLSAWLRSLSFQQLVSAVYKEFPEMRANSVFQG